MNKPVFTETMQIGIVVRDLDAALRHYGDDFGIGPWQVMELTPEDTQELRIYGTPAPYASHVATAMVDQVMWELIEPRDDDSIFARFLAETGGGVHHIAVATPNADMVDRHTGWPAIMAHARRAASGTRPRWWRCVPAENADYTRSCPP